MSHGSSTNLTAPARECRSGKPIRYSFIIIQVAESGSNLNEEYNAYVMIKDKNMSIDAFCRNSRVERFNTAQVFGILNCSAKINGTFDDPDISAVLEPLVDH